MKRYSVAAVLILIWEPFICVNDTIRPLVNGHMCVRSLVNLRLLESLLSPMLKICRKKVRDAKARKGLSVAI